MPIHALHFLGQGLRTWTLVGQIPFLIFVIALYLGGRRQGWPWRATLLATAAFVAGLGAGTAFLPSVLGAAGGGIATWFLAQKVLGLRRPPLTVLALGLVALIAVGRWGCLLNGCCFGTITDLPWGVRYAAGSSPYFLHQSLGLLADGASRSLAVHPYPAYESLGLVLWLPFAYWLGRRLRSGGALLAFSAAFDLGLRGCIEGTRAMINVWWSLLGFWHGLNLFQWVLLAGASCLLLLGILFEHRARATRGGATAPAAATSPYRLWLVYLGLLGLGWASDSAQTAFVHRALLVALAVCVPALAFPRGLGACLRARTWFGYAVAAALVLAVGIHLEAGARAVAPDDDSECRRSPPEHRTWLYDVDQRRGVMVRVGSDSDDDFTLRQREDILTLPSLATRAKQLAMEEASPPVHYTPIRSPSQEPWPAQPRSQEPWPAQPPSHEPWQPAPSQEELPLPESASRSHTWVGGGLHAGAYSHSDSLKTSASNSSDDSCGGTTYTTTTTLDRYAFGGWGQIEREIPYDRQSVFWIGGRAGAGTESQQTQITSNDPSVHESTTSASYSAYYLNLWGEYETPGFAIGLGALGTYDNHHAIMLYPGFHIRGGSPRFGLDVGFADRMSFLGQQNGHAGFSIAIRRGDEIRHPDDAKLRLFVGAFFFPGVDMQRFDVAPGFGTEVYITPKLVLGFNGALFTDQVFAGIHLRTVVGR